MSFFSVATDQNKLHPSISKYIEQSELVKTSGFDNESGCYYFEKNGKPIQCGGLLTSLARKHYPHVKTDVVVGKQNRRKKSVNVRGSSSAQGKRVDKEIGEILNGTRSMGRNKLTNALLQHWVHMGHTLLVSQLPVEIPGWDKMTQADLITRCDADGSLHLWEIKTGMPIGLYRKDGMLCGQAFQNVPYTKFNAWHLQLQYTRACLEKSASIPIPIAQSHVIQVYETKKEPFIVVKQHEPPKWIKSVYLL